MPRNDYHPRKGDRPDFNFVLREFFRGNQIQRPTAIDVQAEVEVVAAWDQPELPGDWAFDFTEVGSSKTLQVDSASHIGRSSLEAATNKKQSVSILSHLSQPTAYRGIRLELEINSLLRDSPRISALKKIFPVR